MNQINNLLAIASDEDLSDSFQFYNDIFMAININMQLVDTNALKNISTYICDMNSEEYLEYLDEIEQLQISGLEFRHFFAK